MINKIRKSNILLVLFDVLLIAGCYILALYVLDYEYLNETAIMHNILLSIFIYQVFLNLFKMYLNLVNYEIGKDYLKYIICAFLSMLTLTIIGKIFL